MLNSEEGGVGISPIENEIKKLFVKMDHLYKRLNRVLSNSGSECKEKVEKPNSLQNDLVGLNDMLGDILDRIQL
jgi:hypothetical protein